MPHADISQPQRRADSTILAVEPRGPGYRLTLRVEPDGEAAFEAQVDVGAHELLAPLEGDRLGVRFDRRDPATVSLDATTVHARHVAAQHSGEAGDAAELARLTALRDSGAITEGQFREQKARLAGVHRAGSNDDGPPILRAEQE